jgi:hypothetical protein
MSDADHADFWTQVRLIARDESKRSRDGGSSLAEDGIIAQGSWNPVDGTVSVLLIETASIITDGTEQPLVLKGIQLATTVAGHQGPPVGGERVILLRRHSGWLAILEHGQAAGTPDDSPGAPAGENWYVHPKTKSYQKFKNTGNVDVKANNTHNVNAASSTHTVTGSETHSAATFGVTASESASIIAPSVQIGPSGGPYLNIGGGGLGSGFALVRVFELNALITAFNAHTHSGVLTGGGTTGTPTATASPATGSTDTTAG